MLGSGRKFAVADMVQLQNNDLSIPARSLVPLLRDLDIADPVVKKAADRLLHWNYVLDKDSVEAGIYEMFQRHLMANVRDIMVPQEARGFVGNPPHVADRSPGCTRRTAASAPIPSPGATRCWSKAWTKRWPN